LRLKREILKKKRGWKYVYLVWVSQVVGGGRDVGMGAGDALTVAFSRLMRAGVWSSMRRAYGSASVAEISVGAR